VPREGVSACSAQPKRQRSSCSPRQSVDYPERLPRREIMSNTAKIDMKLEVVSTPVSDVDRAATPASVFPTQAQAPKAILHDINSTRGRGRRYRRRRGRSYGQHRRDEGDIQHRRRLAACPRLNSMCASAVNQGCYAPTPPMWARSRAARSLSKSADERPLPIGRDAICNGVLSVEIRRHYLATRRACLSAVTSIGLLISPTSDRRRAYPGSHAGS
jgi:hypothetical protein